MSVFLNKFFIDTITSVFSINIVANITVIANDIDAESLLSNCIDEEYHERICIIQEGTLAAASKSDEPKLEKPVQKKHR